MSKIRRPNKHTDAKGYRIADGATFMYEEGTTFQEINTMTNQPTNQNTIEIFVTSDIQFNNGDKLMIPNRSQRPYIIKSIPRSEPKYNRRRGKYGNKGAQVREWTLNLNGD